MAQTLMAKVAGARVAAVDGTKVVMEMVMGLVSTVAVKLISRVVVLAVVLQDRALYISGLLSIRDSLICFVVNCLKR